MKGKRRLRSGQASAWTRVLVLALCFLAGVGLGQAASSMVPDAVGAELTEFLHRFLTLEDPAGSALFPTLVLYFRYPLLAVLLGFASVGVVMLPLLTVMFGFFLSFSVCCFTAAFGGGGVLLALAVFGLRCLVSLPCYFLLAVGALETSAALLAASLGKSRASVRYGRFWWRCCGACGLFLLAGACVETICSPWLVRLALERLLL